MSNLHSGYMFEDLVADPDERRKADEFKCAVCYSLWDNPVQTPDCSHIFCKTCVEDQLACPTCRMPFGGDKRPTPLQQSNPFVLRQVNAVQVICPNSRRQPDSGDAEGSAGGGAGEPLSKRAKIAKPFAVSGSSSRALCDESDVTLSCVPCGGAGGDSVSSLSNPYRPDTCSAACLWSGSYGDLLAKHLGECAYQEIDCPRGCGERMQRKDRSAHESVCAKLFAECSICGDKMRPKELEQHRRSKAELHVQILERKFQDANPVLLELRKISQKQEAIDECMNDTHNIMDKSLQGFKTHILAGLNSGMSNLVRDFNKAITGIANAKFAWVIDVAKLFRKAKSSSDFISSPSFSVSEFAWHVEVYPINTSGYNAGHVGVYLVSDERNKCVRAQATIALATGQAELHFQGLLVSKQQLDGVYNTTTRTGIAGGVGKRFGKGNFITAERLKVHPFVTLEIEMAKNITTILC
ncbi:unnamed protein product [Amoebophrya sp. A120]|nr:unnamed protein product [Amoebophrya sp. A120]|eukprot:GSA120T00011121001.1